MEDLFGNLVPVVDAWPRDHVERFWRAYPRKVGKADAKRALERIRKSGEVPFEKIEAAVLRYATWINEPGWKPHCCYPATWLNGARWDDELPSTQRLDRVGNGFTALRRSLMQ